MVFATCILENFVVEQFHCVFCLLSGLKLLCYIVFFVVVGIQLTERSLTMLS